MRLWSLHPCYLDTKGLVALWREALLAQHVLAGKTVGYKHHPQLLRFSAQADPLTAIGLYLANVWAEAEQRGYHFSKEKILHLSNFEAMKKISVTQGQLRYEQDWLCSKLQLRDPLRHQEMLSVNDVSCHPLFVVIDGVIEPWEKITTDKIKSAADLA